MTSLTIRKAQNSDLNAIAGVNQTTWQATYADLYPTDFLKSRTLESMTKEWEVALQDRNPSVSWFVAEEGEKIVGYAGAGRIPDSGLEYGAELYSIIVSPDQQKKGIGSKLLGEAARFLQRLEVKSLMVWIPQENPFHRFYEKQGGQKLDHEMEVDYGGKKVTVICYGWKKLDELAKL